MQEYKIQIDIGVLGSLFTKPGQKKGVLVIAPGLPQYIQKCHKIIQQACDLGYSILVVKYPGTWESSGKFTIHSSTNAIEMAISIAKKGSAIDLYSETNISWSSKHIIVIGYSYGALPVMKASYSGKIPTLLICPFLSSLFQENGEDIEKTLSFIERGYPNVYNFSKNKLLNEMEKIDFPDDKKSLVVIRGEFDSAITNKTYDFLKKKYGVKIYVMPIAHSLVFDKKFESFIQLLDK